MTTEIQINRNSDGAAKCALCLMWVHPDTMKYVDIWVGSRSRVRVICYACLMACIRREKTSD